MRLVLDTNVWLDWLLFDDPSIAPLRRARAAGSIELVADPGIEAELARVLAYDFGRHSADAARQADCLAAFRALAVILPSPEPAASLPRCRDPDDQKFLDLALASSAQALLTKDHALLDLARRAPFGIETPARCVERHAHEWPAGAPLESRA